MKLRTFHRRKVVTVFLICMAALIVLVSRLGYLMLARSDYYSEKAQDLHERERSIKAARGIFDFQSHDPLIVTSGKSKHFGSQISIWIISLIVFIHFHASQIVFSYFIPGLFIHIRFDPLNGTVLFHAFLDLVTLQPQFFCQHIDHFFRLFYLTVYHRDRTYSFVRCKYFSGRI